MATNTRVKQYGLSDDPTFDAMMHELGYLAGAWRETKDESYVKKYQILCRALLDMGWDDELDFELLLPEEYMPQEYFDRYQV